VVIVKGCLLNAPPTTIVRVLLIKEKVPISALKGTQLKLDRGAQLVFDLLPCVGRPNPEQDETDSDD
jgi:hypothetical protein